MTEPDPRPHADPVTASLPEAETVPADGGAPAPVAVPRARRLRVIAILAAVAVAVVVIDQLTKHWAVDSVLPQVIANGGAPAYEFLGGLLSITYTENTGAAFSIGTGFTWIFSAIAIVVVIVIVRTSRKLDSVAWAIALGGLLGGALGNLIDRMTRPPGPGRGYVVDFIAFPNFPVFNVADMCIVGSAALMVLLTLLGIEYDGSHRAAAGEDSSAEDPG